MAGDPSGMPNSGWRCSELKPIITLPLMDGENVKMTKCSHL